MATTAELQAILKGLAIAPKTERHLGLGIIDRADARYGGDTAGRDAFLAGLGLTHGQTPPSGWLGAGQGAGGMPTHDPMPASAGPECVDCLVHAWAVLLAMLDAANQLTPPTDQIMRDLAWETYDALVAACPCVGEW